MSKKGLEKFYNEVLPTLKQKYKISYSYGNIYFEDYDAKCFIKKANGQIEEVNLFDIEGVNYVETGHQMLNRLLNPFTEPRVNMWHGQYRWASGYGRTWALTKDELIKKTN
jgi:hypothetical protein